MTQKTPPVIRSYVMHWPVTDAVLSSVIQPTGETVPPQFSLSKIGDVTTATVEVQFNEPVQAADFTAGVTIKVNAAGVAIGSATLQPGQLAVYYVIAAPADINDVVTWEYSKAAGNITDIAGNDLEDVAAQTVTNYIGSHLYFNDFNCSGHLATIGA